MVTEWWNQDGRPGLPLNSGSLHRITLSIRLSSVAAMWLLGFLWGVDWGRRRLCYDATWGLVPWRSRIPDDRHCQDDWWPLWTKARLLAAFWVSRMSLFPKITASLVVWSGALVCLYRLPSDCLAYDFLLSVAIRRYFRYPIVASTTLGPTYLEDIDSFFHWQLLLLYWLYWRGA